MNFEKCFNFYICYRFDRCVIFAYREKHDYFTSHKNNKITEDPDPVLYLQQANFTNSSILKSTAFMT